MTLSFFKKLILIVVLFILLAFRIFAQTVTDQMILLPEKQCTIQTVLELIRSQTNVDLSYGNNFPVKRQLKFDSKQTSVSEILKKIKAETGFSNKIQGNKIMMIPPSKRHTVSGFLRDANSNENLIGANVYTLPDLAGTTANQYGYYSLTLFPDTVTLVISYVGYKTQYMKFLLQSDTVLHVEMESETLEEIVVTGEDNILDITHMSTIQMPVQQIESLPAMAGEVDVMKSLQLLPGVQAGPEGSSGLYVRGGSADQNLILLDGVPVYNASHLFGFLSVFNSDAINHVELIKGGFPARYGGRLSSVVNINMKEGNQQEFRGEGSIGLIASRLTLEGPIKKNRSSFIISGRRTFADLFISPIIRAGSGGNNKQGYYFYDLNVKLNHHINKTNRLYLSVYGGNDKVSTYDKNELNTDTIAYKKEEDYMLAWGNITTALRLNSILNPKLFSNLTLTFSQYNFITAREIHREIITPNSSSVEDFKSKYVSGIRDFAIKQDFDFIPGLAHYIKSGVYGVHHTFTPGVSTYRAATTEKALETYRIEGIEYGGYVEDDISISKKLKVNLGVHYAGFFVEKKNYASFQPRMALRYLLSDKIALKASYVQMQQFIHLLTNVGVGLPTDLWVPATQRATPEQSKQSAIGFTYRANNMYELTIESYYKTMTGLIEYKNGASYMDLDKNWQTKIETGEGESYGGELFLKKNEGKWTGWLGYTLAWANRYFKDVNYGKVFPYKYDRRHDLEMALMYTWNKRMDLAFTWTYGSGYPTTLPTAAYTAHLGNYMTDSIPHANVHHYPSRNNFRMRDYHRLDITISFFKQKKWGERKWILGLYNAYSRRNPFYLIMEEDPFRIKGGSKVVQRSLFPIIPAISYNFKF